MGDRRRCIQCGHTVGVLESECPELPDGTWDPKTRVCRDKQACRDRWWARLAYELELI